MQIKKQISITGRTHWIYLWDFRSCCSSRLHKIS